MAQCLNCKSFVTDGAAFCSTCGKPMQPVNYANPSPMQQPVMYMQPMVMGMQPGVMVQKPKSRKPMLIVLFSILAVGLTAVLVLLLLSNAYRQPVNSYYKGLENRDYKALTGAFLPAIAREMDDDRRAAGLSEQEYMEDILGDVEITSYKIKEANSISTLSLSTLRLEINMKYGSKYDIDKGYQVKVRVDYKNAGYEDYKNLTMTLIHCDEGWFVVNDGVLIQSYVIFDDIFSSAYSGYNNIFANW